MQNFINNFFYARYKILIINTLLLFFLCSNSFSEDTKNHNYEFENLPKVYGEGALEKFSDFYSSLQKIGLNLKLVKQFNYYHVNRWDLLLEDEKLIKLPPENYEESVIKFLEIYENTDFEKFKVFDFRIKNELIMR